jgi:hypothetical protein
MRASLQYLVSVCVFSIPVCANAGNGRLRYTEYGVLVVSKRYVQDACWAEFQSGVVFVQVEMNGDLDAFPYLRHFHF